MVGVRTLPALPPLLVLLQACSCGPQVVGPGADAGLSAADASLPTPTDASSNAGADGGSHPDAATPGADAGPLPPDAAALAPDSGQPATDDAVIVQEDLPASLGCAGTYDGIVVVQNTGTSTWTRADGYKLGAVGDADPFYGPDTRVWLSPADSVAPGASYTFHIPLVAPAQPGPLVTDWQMVRDGLHWFGQTATQTVQVQCVDASTLTGKLVMGYQGWFFCPGDGSPLNRWVHWFGAGMQPTVDLWPDTSELTAAERCDSGYTLPDGSPAYLYSAWNAQTVERHFRWMADHDLDGVLLQRFSSGLSDANNHAALDKVAQNVRAGAEASGRVFAVMYDISGHPGSTLVQDLESDWTYLVKTKGITQSPRYLRHRGRPLLAIWGFGFADRPGTTADLAALVDFFKNNPDPDLKVTLMGGVPREWRDDATWAGPLRSFDVLSPWTVGAYRTDADVDAYQPRLAADLADCNVHGLDFLPVIWPGFSWHNLKGDAANAFPRRAGALYWRQVYDAVGAGVAMLYGAMFDEVDEGTAMYKVAPTAAQTPTQAPFVPLDVDGVPLSSDFYLRLADQAGRALRKQIALTPAVPLTPP
jgi:hypothetical protein